VEAVEDMAKEAMEVEDMVREDMAKEDMEVAIMMVEEADTAEESDGKGGAGTG